MANDNWTLQLFGNGYVETPLMPSFRILIVGHASPRWEGASNSASADAKNLGLSKRRSSAVRRVIESFFAKSLGSLVSIRFKEEISSGSGEIGIESAGHGSKEALQRVGTKRNNDDSIFRRVDVTIKIHQWRDGEVALSRKNLKYIAASKFWHVSTGETGEISIGASIVRMRLKITNDLSGQSMEANLTAGGGAFGAGMSITNSWGDPQGFYTKEAVVFDDFVKSLVRYEAAGASLLLGYERSYISFLGLGKGAQRIPVGGWTFGFQAGASASVRSGTIDPIYQPTDLVTIEGTDRTSESYIAASQNEFSYSVLFETGKDRIEETEIDLLDSVLQTALESIIN